MKRDKIDIVFVFLVVIAIIEIIFMLTSCSTVKKQTQLKEMQHLNEKISENTLSQTTISIDTTKVSNAETNAYSVEFFKPDEISDYDKILAKMRENNEPFSDIGIVKSIGGSVTKSNQLQNGIVEEKSSSMTNIQKDSSSNIQREEKTVTVTQSFWQRYKWYFIIGAIIICIGIFLAIKNKFFKI